MYKQDIFQNIIAVSHRKLSKHPFLEQVEIVCHHRPKAFLLREKDLSETEYAVLAQKVLSICHEYQVACILHTYFAVAQELGCDAIHLPLPLLRIHKNNLAAFSKIGTSIHSLEEAKEAETLGVTYCTAGHIYATDCKKDLPPRGLSFLQDVCDHATIPIYAIGGIKCDPIQIEEVLRYGAKGACIMSAMMQLDENT